MKVITANSQQIKTKGLFLLQFCWSRRTLNLRGPSADAAPEPWVIWNQWY